MARLKTTGLNTVVSFIASPASSKATGLIVDIFKPLID
jgi:hypothetical protein